MESKKSKKSEKSYESRMQDRCSKLGAKVSKMRLSGVQNGFVVVPSVPDGWIRIPLADREDYTGTLCRQGCPDCPKW